MACFKYLSTLDLSVYQCISGYLHNREMYMHKQPSVWIFFKSIGLPWNNICVQEERVHLRLVSWVMRMCIKRDIVVCTRRNFLCALLGGVGSRASHTHQVQLFTLPPSRLGFHPKKLCSVLADSFFSLFLQATRHERRERMERKIQ